MQSKHGNEVSSVSDAENMFSDWQVVGHAEARVVTVSSRSLIVKTPSEILVRAAEACESLTLALQLPSSKRITIEVANVYDLGWSAERAPCPFFELIPTAAM